MTVPARRRGFRSLVLGGVRWRWRLEPGGEGSRLVIYGPSSSSARLAIELPDWRDPWLALDGAEVRGAALHLSSGARNAPAVIGPAFVRAAIEAALQAGFRPEERGRTFTLVRRGETFTR